MVGPTARRRENPGRTTEDSVQPLPTLLKYCFWLFPLFTSQSKYSFVIILSSIFFISAFVRSFLAQEQKIFKVKQRTNKNFKALCSPVNQYSFLIILSSIFFYLSFFRIDSYTCTVPWATESDLHPMPESDLFPSQGLWIGLWSVPSHCGSWTMLRLVWFMAGSSNAVIHSPYCRNLKPIFMLCRGRKEK